jgi:hypothetical protein
MYLGVRYSESADADGSVLAACSGDCGRRYWPAFARVLLNVLVTFIDRRDRRAASRSCSEIVEAHVSPDRVASGAGTAVPEAKAAAAAAAAAKRN